MTLKQFGKFSLIFSVPALLACILNGYVITASMIFLGIGMSHVVFNFRTLVDDHFTSPSAPIIRNPFTTIPNIQHQSGNVKNEPTAILWKYHETQKVNPETKQREIEIVNEYGLNTDAPVRTTLTAKADSQSPVNNT